MTRTITLTGFAVLAVALVACEVVARRTRRLPSLGQAVGILARNRGAWLLMLAGWIWLGWHLFVRVDR